VSVVSRMILMLSLLACSMAGCRDPASPSPPRLRVILTSEAGDDATASLAMILEARGVAYTYADLKKQIYASGSDTPTALDLVNTAESLHLKVRGVHLRDEGELHELDLPCIAHVLDAEGPFPRELKTMGVGSKGGGAGHHSFY